MSEIYYLGVIGTRGGFDVRNEGIFEIGVLKICDGKGICRG